MATSNFHNVNATKVFATEVNEHWEVDDLIQNIQADLKSDPWFMADNGGDPHELRSFPSTIIGTIAHPKAYKVMGDDAWIEAQITLIWRAGYYANGNLDWDLSYYLDGGEINDTPESIMYYYDDITEKKAEWMANWAYKEGQKLVRQVEKLYRFYSDPLRCLGTASNGESFYVRD